MISNILQKHKLSGGSTTDIKTGQVPVNGYAISIYKQHEHKTQDDLQEWKIAKFIRFYAHLFNKDNHYLGTWHDESTGTNYLDIVIVLNDKSKALALAREHNQEAIYDLEKQEEIRVDL